MSSEYARNHCKIAVGKVLQTIGWHSINSTSLEVLTDILSQYMSQIAKLTNDFANEFGQTEPNLDHLGLAFQELGINLHELDEYVTYVNFGAGPSPVPKFPIPKENNLNFLKPGSQEVVTRPVHVHEHLPPMYSLLDNNANEDGTMVKKEETEETAYEQFKKPADVSSPEFKKPKKEEEGSRPTREISSVMMTTSGFISPAREGRLPEARTPAPPPEPVKPPSPPPLIAAPPEIIKKKIEKKKDKVPKDAAIKPPFDEKPLKKMPVVKEKSRQMKNVVPNPLANNQLLIPNQPQLPLSLQSDVRISPVQRPNPKSNYNRALAAAKAKTERLNTTITPIPVKQEAVLQPPIPHLVPHSQPHSSMQVKLFSEPDKKKINILRKISNVKEKHEKPARKENFHSHVLNADDIVSKISLSSDITIEPIMPVQQIHRSPEKMECYFDGGSPPGTPPTPRTPEMMTQIPPVKEKRKRKDKAKIKKVKKQHTMEGEVIDMTIDRPKTPEVTRQLPIPPLNQFPFPFPNFGGPGLIPPLNNPLFSYIPNLTNFGENPYFPSMVPNLPSMQAAPMPFVPKKSRAPPKPKPKQVVEPVVVDVPKQEVPVQQETPSTSQLPIPPVVPVQPQLQEDSSTTLSSESAKKLKDHKKDKKDKIKKKNKKDKLDKEEKKKLKEAKKEQKEKVKKEKKKKEKETTKEIETPIPKILLKVNSPSPRPETPDTMKKLNIKPIVKKEEDISLEERKREPSPGLAKISALVTGPPKPKTVSPLPPPDKPVEPPTPAPTPVPKTPAKPKLNPLKPKQSPPKPKKLEPPPFVKKDEQGNEIWICPACGQQDDGRPMIGCDGCDAWYHWVCVGIQVPPDENENWYCKPCLCRKNEDLQDRKKKRKKKEKKDH